MLLLAHLLRRNPEWRDRRIRLMRVTPKEDARRELLQHLEALAASARIAAGAEVHVSNDPAALIQSVSADAAIVILGFEAPEEGRDAQFFARMEGFAGSLPRVLIVDSAGGMELES
ncbi:MAG: hypothetical protein Fur0037_18780 [Planctomycetota bacterium]